MDEKEFETLSPNLNGRVRKASAARGTDACCRMVWCQVLRVGRRKRLSLRPTTPPPNIHVACRGTVLDTLLEKERL